MSARRAQPMVRRQRTARTAALVVLLAGLTGLGFGDHHHRSASGKERSAAPPVAASTTTSSPGPCPAGAENGCDIQLVPATLSTKMTARFAGSQVLNAYRTVGAGGHIDNQYIAVRTGSGVIAVLRSQCPRGGAVPVPDRESGRLSGLGPARGVVVAGASRGCSVTVTLDVAAGIAVPGAAARAVAHDPAFVLTPR